MKSRAITLNQRNQQIKKHLLNIFAAFVIAYTLSANALYAQVATQSNGNGARTGQSQSQYQNPMGFTGQRYDQSTGLNHFLYRAYSPNLGRWQQRDPAGYIDGVNLYEYVAGQPMDATDPLGLESIIERGRTLNARIFLWFTGGQDSWYDDPEKVQRGQNIAFGISAVAGAAATGGVIGTAWGTGGLTAAGSTTLNIGRGIMGTELMIESAYRLDYPEVGYALGVVGTGRRPGRGKPCKTVKSAANPKISPHQNGISVRKNPTPKPNSTKKPDGISPEPSLDVFSEGTILRHFFNGSSKKKIRRNGIQPRRVGVENISATTTSIKNGRGLGIPGDQPAYYVDIDVSGLPYVKMNTRSGAPDFRFPPLNREELLRRKIGDIQRVR